MTKRLIAVLIPVLLVSCAKSRTVNDVSNAELACSTCHGDPARTGGLLDKAAPPAAPHGGDGGAHLAHLQAGVSCASCHVLPGSPSHSNGIVEVTFGGISTTGGATPQYSGGLNGTCSGVYCHGATLNAGGQVPQPSWTSAGGLTCSSCHGYPPPSPHPAATTCNGCHPDTVNANETINVAGGRHANGTVDVVGGHPAGFAAKEQHGYEANRRGLTYCGGCHGADFNGGSVGVSCNACHTTNNAGGWQTNCTFCHGTRLATYTSASLDQAAPPVGTEGEMATTTRAVGAHAAHLTAGGAGSLGPKVTCATCHTVPTSLDHVTGTPVVTLTGDAARDGVTPSWNATAATCNTYCHGASLNGGTKTAPSWTGGSGETVCGACHGLPPGGTHPTSNACGTCHDGYTISSVNPALHMNGTPDVLAGAGHPAGFAAKDQHGYDANRRGLAYCANCHGADYNGGNVGVSCNACHTTATWGGWQTNCTFCHGTRLATYTSANLDDAAPPVGTEGEMATTTRAVGAHAAHLTAGGAGSLGPKVACATCHTVPTDLAHVTGTPVVTLTGPAVIGSVTAAWNGTAGTCNAYCHGASLAGGNHKTPSWTGGSTEVACGSCHGVPPPTPHSQSVDCGTCHSGYTQTSVNLALHMNGQLESTSPHAANWANKDQHGYTVNRVGLFLTTTDNACKNCHGANLTGGTAKSCSSAGCHQSTWATNCTFCHGTGANPAPPVDTQGSSDATKTSVGLHAAHLTSPWMTAPACTVCHPNRAGSNVITDTAHIDGNGIAEVEFASLATTGGAAATYTRTSATSASCASVYCHGKFTGGTGGTFGTGAGAAAPNWTSTTQATCTSCHGAPPSTGRHTSVSAHSRAACSTCHGAGYDATAKTVNASTHIDGRKTMGTGTPPGWSTANRNCNNSCHGTNKGTW